MSQPYKVALIGFGVAGSVFHGPLIEATSGLHLEAIVTGDRQRQQQAKASYPNAQVVDTPEQLNMPLDLVVVAAPNRFHVPLALEALQRGLHVVIDKPVAPSLEEARRLIPYAERVSVFHNRRWDGDFLTVQGLVQEGVLGPITRFESRFERWRPEPRPGAWREMQSHQEGGGLLLDLGSHLVDQALCLFGPPLQVYAEIDRRRPGVLGDDDCFLALQFPGGIRAHLWMSSLARVEGPRFVLRGMGGCYQKFGLDPQEAALRAGRAPGERDQPGILSTLDSQPLETRPGDYGAFYRELEHSLRTGGAPPVTLAEALQVMEILQAAVNGL